MSFVRSHLFLAFVSLASVIAPVTAHAQERLCDPGAESCRDILLNYIRSESVGIDVAFWFMEDARYTNELIEKWKAGVPVRVLIDTRANEAYPLNIDRVKELQDAGIPIRRASSGLYLHWKMMLFSGQNIVEFSGANYSADAWRPATATPYENYTDESIFFTGESSIVNSFRTTFDDMWVSTTRFADYANVTGPLARSYDTFPIDPELNLPPQEPYRPRAVNAYNAETQAIDVIMYRVLDAAHADAMIAAVTRGVPVRLITEPEQYRDPTRLWHSYNIDRMFTGGVQIKHRAHAGLNHQKSVLLRNQGMVIFGSSNWTESSNNGQYEHNMFTNKAYLYNWFVDQFERKWNNTGGVVENVDFVPLPPDAPKTPLPADAAVDVGETGTTLSWYGGPWAHKYDVYLGTTTNPSRVAESLKLGPSESATERQQYTLTEPLIPGTTYYWRVVAKTMADKESASQLWSFTTAGTAPPPEAPAATGSLGPGDVLLYASKATRTGTWTNSADGTAAGAVGIWQPNAGAAKVTSAAANPANYFELKFNAAAGVPYRLWIRSRAQNNSWANDSVFIQFSGSVNASGTAQWRIGTSSATEMNLEDCSGCGVALWGWQDNGWGVGVLGPLVYFASTGEQTIRVQQREDGIMIDQIMLSPEKFLASAPGALKNDATIFPESAASDPPPPPSSVTVVRQPYLQSVTSTSAVIVWTTREAGPATVKILRTGSPTRTISASSQLFTTSTTGLSANYYQHVARITGLSAATSYEYDILVDGVDANPGTDSLKTAPGTASSAVKFIAFGDSGVGSTAQQQISNRIEADNFDFALHGGDVAYGLSSGTGPGTYRTLEDWFFNVYKDWLRSHPMFPSMGNHDSNSSNNNGQHYLDAFVLPENGGDGAFPDHAERYYSFDYGPVHVVVLDTELAFQNTSRRAAQLAWLNADLSATSRPWKVAIFHRAPYSSGGEHGSDLTVRAAFGPVFEDHGVQLVLSAHEHDYERTNKIGGVTYVVTGGGGGPLYPAGTSSFTAASASRYHYMRGDVSECSLKLDAVGTDGSVFDTVTLTRCAPPPSSGDDIVLYAKDAPVVQGAWRRQSDMSAAGGALLRHPNAGAAKLSSALANPVNYFEMTFNAEAGVPYHLWIRGKADSNSWANDSVFVQFSSGTTYTIGTTKSVEMNLEDCSGCGLSGWGWQDNGYGAGVFGPNITFSSGGSKTIRVQTREDGLSIDQIVLSPSTYLAKSPGTLKNDSTILTAGGAGEPPPTDTTNPTAEISSPSEGATVSGTVSVAVSATDDVGVAKVDFLVNGSLVGTDTGEPFVFSWNTSSLAPGAYTLQAKAYDAADNTASSAVVNVQVEGATAPPTGDIVLYAGDVTVVSGAWTLEADSTAAGGKVVRNPNAGAARVDPALASPVDYVEFTFNAEAGVPYHLWIRGRAQGNGWKNDSVYVQFSNVTGYPIGTTKAAEVNLEDCSGCGLSGWGWQDNGYGTGVMGPDIVFSTSGTQTIRIQTREDGMFVDQIVLSRDRFLTTSPGALKNDTTVVPK